MTGLAGATIAFAGTPDFAVPCLQMLLDAGARIPLVLTQPDRPAGRGRHLQASPVKQLAVARDLPVAQPHRLDEPALFDSVVPRPDCLLVVAYGLLLPDWALTWPAAGCINVHASLLPRWRGAAPIQRAIQAGDRTTGVSIMHMQRGLDTGPVFATAATPVAADDTGDSLHDRLSELGAALARDTLPGILAGTLKSQPQDDMQATYASKLTKQQAALDWRQPAAALERQVRAFNPWPVTEAMLSDGRRLRVWQASVIEPAATSASPGTIVAAGRDGIDVATGEHVLRLERIQPAGKKPMPSSAWLASQNLDGLSFAVA